MSWWNGHFRHRAAGPARTGTVPEFYEPLRQWVNGSIQVLYMTIGFA